MHLFGIYLFILNGRHHILQLLKVALLTLSCQEWGCGAHRFKPRLNVLFKVTLLRCKMRGANSILQGEGERGLLVSLSNPHLSSKAEKRRASRMFSSGSQVLYLRHNNREERCLATHRHTLRNGHLSMRKNTRSWHFYQSNLALLALQLQTT